MCREEKKSGGGSNPIPTPEEDNTLHKGDVIKISSENPGYQYYLVLKTDGDEATLINMDYDESTKFASSNTEEYEGSLLDIACNTTFYGDLSSTLQNAIVEKTINLNQYTFDDTNFDEDTHPFKGELSSKVTLGTIDRKVYALDIEDIEEYLGSTYSINDVMELTNGGCWLRSITSDKTWRVTNACIDPSERSVFMSIMPMLNNIRPMLVVDLTKNIEYEKKIKVNIMSYYGSLQSSTYASKGDKVVDLVIDEGDNIMSFVEKTFGANTFIF